MIKKKRPYTAIGYLALAFIVTLLTRDAFCAAGGTHLHDLRLGSHSGFTRVVFDLQGERPLRVGPATSEKIEIDFKHLTTRIKAAKLPVKHFKHIAAVRFEQTSNLGRVAVSFKRNMSVNAFYLDSDPPKPGWYRLVLDLSSGSPQSKKPAEQAAPAAENKPAPAKAEVSSMGSSVKAKADPPPEKNKEKESAPPATPAGPHPSPPEPQTANDNPFLGADRNFEKHQDDLAKHALEIIQQYQEAINKNPAAPEAPMALYRCALAHVAVGDEGKAEQYFRHVISAYPDHHAARLCWLELGRLQIGRNNYIEAIEAIRAGMKLPLEDSEKVEAYYLLGRAFSSVGSHKEAIENLNQCLTMDPKSFLKHPALLKFLGESLFAEKQFQDSSRYLLQYLNLQENDAGRDMILARIAEALDQQGEQALSEKLYSFIEKEHPNSEGFIISQIRKAESLEKQSGEEAHKIYEKLTQYPLTAPLMKLVTFKLASWEWQRKNYAKCLEMINRILDGRAESAEYDEFLTLRQKVVTDWLMQSYAAKDYMKVIQLYREHMQIIESQENEDLYTAIAESYAQIRLYAEAINIYQMMANTIQPKKDEWLVRIAQYSFLTGDSDKAEQYLSQVQNSARQPQKAQLLMEINFAKGNHQEVVSQFEALTKDKSDTKEIELPVLLHYVESLMKMNRQKDALSYLKELESRLEQANVEQKVHVCILKSECHQVLKELPSAIAVIEEAIALTPSDELKNQFNYQLSKLYVEAGQFDKATEKLSRLMESSQPFWKNVAQQELNHLQLLQSSGVRSNSS